MLQVRSLLIDCLHMILVFSPSYYEAVRSRPVGQVQYTLQVNIEKVVKVGNVGKVRNVGRKVGKVGNVGKVGKSRKIIEVEKVENVGKV